MRWIKALFARLFGATWIVIKASVAAMLAAGLVWLGFQGWNVWQGHQRGALVQVELLNPSERVTNDAMVEMLRPQLGLSFWQLDLPVIRRMIETHPWVAHAEVYRYWPGTLKIEVVEQIPVARWGKDALVNQRGEVFHPKFMNGVNDLIQLSAINPEPRDVLLMLRDVLGLINPYGLHVKQLHQQADGSWHIVLVSGDEWLLPSSDALQSLKRLLALYGNIPKQENTVMRVDLRYRDGFAVKWSPMELNDVQPTVNSDALPELKP